MNLESKRFPKNSGNVKEPKAWPILRVLFPKSMNAIITPTIAPKYGIILNIPIINPSSTAYFTSIISNAIDIINLLIIPTKPFFFFKIIKFFLIL